MTEPVSIRVVNFTGGSFAVSAVDRALFRRVIVKVTWYLNNLVTFDLAWAKTMGEEVSSQEAMAI